MTWSLSNYYAGKTYNSYIYRNTFENGSAWIRFPGSKPYEVDANVVITSNIARWEPASMIVGKANVVGASALGLLLNSKVIGESFGKVGHEVASNAGPDTVPNAKFKTTPVP
jgi:hypothetical protein